MGVKIFAVVLALLILLAFLSVLVPVGWGFLYEFWFLPADVVNRDTQLKFLGGGLVVIGIGVAAWRSSIAARAARSQHRQVNVDVYSRTVNQLGAHPTLS